MRLGIVLLLLPLTMVCLPASARTTYDPRCGIHHTLEVFYAGDKTNNDYLHVYDVILKNLRKVPAVDFYFC